ncbi:MAG: hypothetical protein ACYCWE_15330 [Eubacteriales bacterium]
MQQCGVGKQHCQEKYGKNPNEYECFKKAQADEYDTYMEYRIMYRLRNFDQHCGNIISKIKGRLDANGKPEYFLLANRDRLLLQFDEWKKEEILYLKQQTENINLFPYIQILYKCILRIYDKIMQIHFNKNFLDSCTKLIKVANEFVNENNLRIASSEIQIDNDFFEQPKMHFEFNDLMISLCKKVLSEYIKNNVHYIKVVYHGEKYKERLNNFALEIDEETASKISQLEFITFNSKKMIRLIYSLNFDTGNMYSVLVDVNFKHEEIKELCADYGEYLKALCKE